VLIQGGIVGQGFAVEIEDRGLGMSDGKLAEANARLADPLPFESAGTDQLGLLVVGQLAKRHDIQITLRRNPYGGTTAIVLLPHGLVVAEGFGELEPAKALEVAPPMLGRHPGGDQNGLADEAATEPDLLDGDMTGEAAVAGAPPLAYQAAPPAVPAPPATVGSHEIAAPPAAAPRAEAGQPPSAQTGAPDPAAAESWAWNGMESPAWCGRPQSPVNPQTPNGTAPPVLPRRVRRASPAPGRREGPSAYSSLPGRFPSPRSPEGTRITKSPIQHGAERGPSMPGLVDGRRQEHGAPEAGGACSSGTAEADGAGSSSAAGEDDPRAP
jgi:hypothetical protein